MNKEDVTHMHTCVRANTHTHTGILLSHKKEYNNDIYSNMMSLDSSGELCHLDSL